MVKPRKHRGGVKKRSRVEHLRNQQLKKPIVVSIEVGRFLSESATRKLRKATVRQKSKNNSNSPITIIDLTTDSEPPLQLNSPPSVPTPPPFCSPYPPQFLDSFLNPEYQEIPPDPSYIHAQFSRIHEFAVATLSSHQ